MKRTLSRRALLVALILFAVGSGTAPATPAGSGDTLSGKQKQAFNKLFYEFQKAPDHKTRSRLALDLIRIGPAAARAFRERLFKAWNKDFGTFDKDFRKAALIVARKARKAAGKREPAEARDRVNALRRKPDLSKEEILQQGNRDLARLREIHVPRPEAVLEAARELAGELTSLRERAEYIGTCDAALSGEPDEESSSKKKRKRRKSGPEAPPFLRPDPKERIELILERGVAYPLFKEADADGLLDKNAENAARIDLSEERNVLDLNVIRLVLGLDPLRMDPKLCAAARDHSRDMREKNFFSHTSPVDGKRTPSARASRFGTGASSENIYRGSEKAVMANKAWFESPGHHKNMLRDGASVMGAGRYHQHWTQMFR